MFVHITLLSSCKVKVFWNIVYLGNGHNAKKSETNMDGDEHLLYNGNNASSGVIE